MPNPAARLIDTQVPLTVYNAASLRLSIIQDQERVDLGVPSTTLASVARSHLLSYNPDDKSTPRRKKGKPRYAQCIACQRTVAVNNAGRMRRHGPATADCPGSLQVVLPDITPATHPLRFSVPAEHYQAIHRRVGQGGSSIAAITEDALRRFARYGHTHIGSTTEGKRT